MASGLDRTWQPASLSLTNVSPACLRSGVDVAAGVDELGGGGGPADGPVGCIEPPLEKVDAVRLAVADSSRIEARSCRRHHVTKQKTTYFRWGSASSQASCELNMIDSVAFPLILQRAQMATAPL